MMQESSEGRVPIIAFFCRNKLSGSSFKSILSTLQISYPLMYNMAKIIAVGIG